MDRDQLDLVFLSSVLNWAPRHSAERHWAEQHSIILKERWHYAVIVLIGIILSVSMLTVCFTSSC